MLKMSTIGQNACVDTVFDSFVVCGK